MTIMIVEETSSKDYLCPMGRDTTHFCGGKECMAWRWAREFSRGKDTWVDSTSRGYCGMVPKE